MATILYRQGEEVLIDPTQVKNHLESGYFLTREESFGDETLIEEPVEETPIELSDENGVLIEVIPEEISDEDELSIEDVRLMADELGIQYPHNSGKEKLLARIERAENGDSD